MAVTVFKDASYNLSGLLSKIEHGDIALPDIQRPFVWSNSRVRDLFDSMYRGFPVGYLLLWATGAEATAKQIGTGKTQSAPSLLIVDGQQRLTSLFAVITGTPVVRKDYSVSKIRVAFRPNDMTFQVTDAAVENDPEFIADISEVFKSGFFNFVGKFLAKLEVYRGAALSTEEKDRLVENIDRLKDIQNYPFHAIELDKAVDEEQVADVFVRINSEGVQLNNADFILTLMSVFWEDGRRELEHFARAAKTPNPGNPSPFNYFIEPSPDQLLRTSVGLAFRRGRLKYVYSILRGKDLETGQFSPDQRDAQFARLQAAHEATLNLTNWHEYLKCLVRSGFRSSRMISSEIAVMYVYMLWLIGRRDFGVDVPRLREVISRWWFMSHTTSRYSGSSETQMESDLNRINAIPAGNADQFCAMLDRIVRDTFTTDYWQITLPNRLNTASAKSPPLTSYWAALNMLNAEMLFSEIKVSSMLDPIVTPIKDMERHHLFPKAHLATMGITEQTRVNAIANMSFVDWTDNGAIAGTSPGAYWLKMTEKMPKDRVKNQMYWHALPTGWEQLGYDEFCEKRRKLIAKVIQDGYAMLCGGDKAAPLVPASIQDLIADGESTVLEFKERARWSHETAQQGKSEQVIVKTIAGFMNAEGGTLLLGVADDGIIKGLEADYATLSKSNRDGYELFLTQLIKDKITGPSASLCRVSFHSVDGQDVCRIDVSASAKHVFACPLNSKDPTDFWLRQGNQTAQLHGNELTDYVAQHWG